MLDRDAIEARLAAGESLRSVARDLGTTYQSLQYHRRRWGGQPLRRAHAAGETHASWRGGRFTDRFGYTMVLAPENGRANKYVAEHILVAEEMIGRGLHSNEVVHHINGRRDDNRPENLAVLTRRAHVRAHAELEAIAMAMVEEGFIEFENGHYRHVTRPPR